MNEITQLCENKLTHLKLDTDIYKSRLKEELSEINSQDGEKYFLSLAESGEQYENENNLLVAYLLGICKTVDMTKPPKYIIGDFPDVDVDYIPAVRNYLKEKFTREQYGEDKVCNIATYTTFGLRSSLIDMAKVFDLDRNEILALTTRLEIKDDDGEILTWDKAIELYDDLREYVERNKEMAEAAKHLMHRNRNMGMHASGLIISNVPINEFVPLVRVKDGVGACSAWVEGLHGSDLGAVGLVKFDYLSLEGTMKIAEATRLVAEETLKDINQSMPGKVSALPGQSNWSDPSYLDDPASLKMADAGDLRMVFQYDGSPGIRRLARQGGVTSFDDLVAYTALYRPGPMKHGMHETFCLRKRGKEKYEIHPLLEPFMAATYGCPVYQEQIMRMLNLVGKIPLKDCEDVRKAISKKKLEKFIKYKEMFVENGQQVLGWTKQEVESLWANIEAFSGYGFGLGHATGYGILSARMLYLKANHPLAFYCAVIGNTKTTGPKDYLKLKEYKLEAERHGIKIRPIDINKSKTTCTVSGNDVYYGFNKLRGVGEDIADQVVAHQPYTDYEDFLRRFGPDAKVNQAVLALRLFDGDPVRLYQFYETYRAADKKRTDRNRRYRKTVDAYREQITALTGLQPEDIDAETTGPEVKTLLKRMNKTITNYERKGEMRLPTLADFDLAETKLDEEFMKLLGDPTAAEEEYYGFIWNHPIEKCRNYSHRTLSEFGDNDIGPVEVEIKKVERRRGKKVEYISVAAEDANGETMYMTVWLDDFDRFKDELTVGNYVRLQVKAPQGWGNYTLAPVNRYRKPPKEFDIRVFPLD